MLHDVLLPGAFQFSVAGLVQEIQQRDWAVTIAFAKHYRPATLLEAAVLSRADEAAVPEFVEHYRDTIAWWLIGVVADAEQVAAVQLLNDEQYDSAVTIYTVVGRDRAGEAKALHLLERGFAQLGVPTRTLHDLTDAGLSYCSIDTTQHDPEKVVAAMTAPVVRHQSRLFLRRPR
jgi:hypothetical protein